MPATPNTRMLRITALHGASNANLKSRTISNHGKASLMAKVTVPCNNSSTACSIPAILCNMFQQIFLRAQLRMQHQPQGLMFQRNNNYNEGHLQLSNSQLNSGGHVFQPHQHHSQLEQTRFTDQRNDHQDQCQIL